MRALIILTSILSLSGCISMDALTSSNTTPSDTSYFIIDTKKRFLCMGNSNRCFDMTKIVSAQHLLEPIEQEYDSEIKGPNYPVSLMRIIMNPKDDSYQTTPAGSEGRYFKIPRNKKTNIAWKTLATVETYLYEN